MDKFDKFDETPPVNERLLDFTANPYNPQLLNIEALGSALAQFERPEELQPELTQDVNHEILE